jgi:hypothetical protein
MCIQLRHKAGNISETHRSEHIEHIGDIEHIEHIEAFIGKCARPNECLYVFYVPYVTYVFYVPYVTYVLTY